MVVAKFECNSQDQTDSFARSEISPIIKEFTTKIYTAFSIYEHTFTILTRILEIISDKMHSNVFWYTICYKAAYFLNSNQLFSLSFRGLNTWYLYSTGPPFTNMV